MAIALFLVMLMAMIVVHELGHAFAAKWLGMRVTKVQLFFGRPLAALHRGETTWAIGWLPLGGSASIAGMTPYGDDAETDDPRAYWRAPVWKRCVVIVAGPAVNIACAFVLLAIFFAIGAPQIGTSTRVADLEAGSAAARAGLERDDVIISVDGERVIGGEALADSLRTTEPHVLVVERDGAEQAVRMPARTDSRVGITLGLQREGTRRDPVPQAVTRAAQVTGGVGIASASGIGQLFVSADAREQLGTVVGVSASSQRAADLGLFLFYLAIVSLMLGYFNLLPILPLDGGHIVVACIEGIRRRPLSERALSLYAIVGITLVVFALFIGLNNDVQRLLSGRDLFAS